MLTKKIDPELFEHPEKHIPAGMYCYTPTEIIGTTMRIKTCPFWDKNRHMPDQMSGYCHLLKKGDWMKDGTFLLWDQCKECGINCDYGDEEE